MYFKFNGCNKPYGGIGCKWYDDLTKGKKYLAYKDNEGSLSIYDDSGDVIFLNSEVIEFFEELNI